MKGYVFILNEFAYYTNIDDDVFSLFEQRYFKTIIDNHLVFSLNKKETPLFESLDDFISKYQDVVSKYTYTFRFEPIESITIKVQ